MILRREDVLVIADALLWWFGAPDKIAISGL